MRALFAVLLASSAWAGEGTVRGVVQLASGADAGGVVVYIPDVKDPPRHATVAVGQKGRTFTPGFVVVQVGDSIDFVNDDSNVHNVFTKSEAFDFDVGQTPVGQHRVKPFPKVGLFDIFCNIHEEMKATVSVLPGRAFTTTAADGSFVLEHVPPGRHTVNAWRGRGFPARAEVEVQSGQTAALSLVLNEPPPAPPERHPDKNGGSYDKHPKTYP